MNSEPHMNLLQYLIKADSHRFSRIHDLMGNRLGLSQYTEIPNALLTTLVRHAFGYRPSLPWIPSTARRALAKSLSNASSVLEFGSGMSTVWLARRAGYVHSIEHDDKWFKSVTALLNERCLENRVKYELRPETAAYADLSAYEDGSLDLCIIDGIRRDECAEQAVCKIKPGGHIYLDNSDNTDAEARRAESHLLDALSTRRGRFERFIGFPPTTFHVNQGLLVELP
jgi:predicted O-methyltransferase YrrM